MEREPLATGRVAIPRGHATLGALRNQPAFGWDNEYDEHVVSFEVAGRVDHVEVRRGDLVKSGQLLSRLDDTIAKLTCDGHEQEANAMEADLGLLATLDKNMSNGLRFEVLESTERRVGRVRVSLQPRQVRA